MVAIWVGYIAFVLSVASASALQAESNADGVLCITQTNLSSPLVSAQHVITLNASGCFSAAVTKRSQEVHHIRINSVGGTHGEESLRGSKPVLSIFVKPLIDNSVYSGRLILVLEYAGPAFQEKIKLKLRSQRVQPFGHKLIHNTHVELSEDSIWKNFSVKHRKSLSSSEVLHRFGAITSYTVVDEANSLVLHVGTNSDMPKKCDLKNLARTPLVVPQIISERPIEGCVYPNRMDVGSSDVYVLELLQPPSEPWDAVSTVLIESPVPRSRNITLVLKSHRKMLWKVLTDNISGHLLVLADRGSELSTDARAEALPGRREVQLLLLPEDFGPLMVQVTSDYGAPTVYAKLAGANRVVLRAGAPAAEAALATGGDPFRRRKRPPPPSSASRRKLDLVDGVVVLCGEQSVEVSVRLELLQRLRLRPELLTLRDPRCRARSNGTHAVVASDLHRCGARVGRLATVFSQELWLRSGDCTDVAVAFRCEGRRDPGPDGSDHAFLTPRRKTSLYSMELSVNERHTERLSERVPLLPGDPVFVKVSTEPGEPPSGCPWTAGPPQPPDPAPGVHIGIDDCWISNSTSDEVPRDRSWRLFSGGCPLRPVHVFASPGSAANHFGFRVPDRWPSVWPLYVQCRLGICASRSGLGSCPGCSGERRRTNLSAVDYLVAGPAWVAALRHKPAASPSLDLFVAVALAAFLLGTAFSALIWFIRRRTGSEGHPVRAQFLFFQIRAAGTPARPSQQSRRSRLPDDRHSRPRHHHRSPPRT